MSLPTRLLLLVLLAVAPGLAIQIYDQVELRRERRVYLHEEALRASRLAAADLERIIEGARNLLLAVVNTPAVRTLNREVCSAYFAELAAAYAGFTGLVAIDVAGAPLCLRGTAPPDYNLGDRLYLRQALTENKFIVGEYTLSKRHAGVALLPVAMPFRDVEGRVAGVVAAGIRLEWLSEQLAARPLPPGSSISVADRNGIILARVPEPARWIGQPMPATGQPFLRATHEGTVETVGFDGVTRIFGYVPPGTAPAPDVFVAAGLSTASADAAINMLTTRGLAMIAFGLGLALFVAWLIGEYSIRRPIAKLLWAAGAWTKGDLSVRTKFRGDDEIGRLGLAFDAMADALVRRETAVQARTAELESLLTSAPLGTSFYDRQHRYLRVNDVLADINGLPAAEHIGRTIEEVIPVNAPIIGPVIDRVFATGEAVGDVEVTGETRREPGVRRHWLAGFYPVRNDKGEVAAVGAWITEITARKRDEERLKLLAREVDHRAKNMLAVIQVMVRMTRADDMRELVKAITGRIGALARAHTLLAQSRWQGAELTRLAEDEMAPYRASARVRIAGPAIALAPRAAQSLAMALHELATNAVKYGALSLPAGRVAIEWQRGPDGSLALRWCERGGPPVAPPTRQGLGTGVIQRSIKDQLDGAVAFDWRAEGLICTITVPPTQLAPQREAA